MIVLGLTGQSGAGKGVFSEIAKGYHGFAAIDTDKTAREVVCKGQPCLCELVECFSCDILTDKNLPHVPSATKKSISHLIKSHTFI